MMNREKIASELVKVAKDLVGGTIRKNQPALQVKKNGNWEYVFARMEGKPVATTKNREKAILGDKRGLDYFQSKYGNDEFRVEKKANKEAAFVNVDDAVSRISRMTNRNDHTSAMLYLVSKVLRHSGLTKEMKKIEEESSKLGYTTNDSIQQRRYIGKLAFKILEKRYSPEDYDKIHGAF